MPRKRDKKADAHAQFDRVIEILRTAEAAGLLRLAAIEGPDGGTHIIVGVRLPAEDRVLPVATILPLARDLRDVGYPGDVECDGDCDRCDMGPTHFAANPGTVN